jgi:membrane-associated phospholipid phosphatase
VRALVFAGAGSLVAVIGTSRIYFNVHHPSDVAAGYLAALAWIVAVAFGDHLASQGVLRRDDWYRLARP